MFFSRWASIGRIVLLATLVHLALAAALRITGPRALAKVSASDLMITIALSSKGMASVADAPAPRDQGIASG